VSASLPLLAGSVSTAIFVFSTMPMLVKAGRTKDLASYSLGNIVLANVGNLIYAVYVLSLPLGPIWALHGFHLGATGLMLFWYLRHARQRRPRRAARGTRRGARSRELAAQTDLRRTLSASAGKSVVSVFQTTR
jgi:uncharacterized protein with PQ loop repeat